MALTMELDTAAVRPGGFNYMAGSSEPSLYRNGKVLTRRDLDGSDNAWIGVDLVETDMPVMDARQHDANRQPTLLHNGFELQPSRLHDPDLDFFSHDAVLRSYYPGCEEIVRAATGAAVVAAFDHNVRSATGKKSRKRIDGGQQVQGPARVVHGDYTLTSAPQRLRDLTRPPGANDTIRGLLPEGQALLDRDRTEHAITRGRFAIINVWRNIVAEPVETDPLALCDAGTVRPEDLVVFEIHYKDRVGENYFARHSDGHGWYLYPKLTRDEALLIKQWDSAGELARSEGATGDGADGPCTFSFHSAFRDRTTRPDAPDRWSTEVRCVALYD